MGTAGNHDHFMKGKTKHFIIVVGTFYFLTHWSFKKCNYLTKLIKILKLCHFVKKIRLPLNWFNSFHTWQEKEKEKQWKMAWKIRLGKKFINFIFSLRSPPPPTFTIVIFQGHHHLWVFDYLHHLPSSPKISCNFIFQTKSNW